MKAVLAGIALIGGILLGATPALADSGPGGGPAFGHHVSEMAPEHSKDHGAVFGGCVSTMARTDTCPNHAH